VLEFAISVFELDLFAFEAFQQLVPGALLPRATLLPSHILLVKPISPSRAPAGGVGITDWLAAVRHFDQTNDRFGSFSTGMSLAVVPAMSARPPKADAKIRALIESTSMGFCRLMVPPGR
jgi:hypothetical protein